MKLNENKIQRGKERKKKEQTQITNVKDRMYKGEEERRTRSFLIQQKHNQFHCTCTKQEESSKNTTKPMFAASAREELSKYKRTSLASDGRSIIGLQLRRQSSEGNG